MRKLLILGLLLFLAVSNVSAIEQFSIMGAAPSSGGGGGLSDPMTTRGDIIIRNAANATARLGVGTAGQVVTSDGTDISWGTTGAGDVLKIGTPVNSQVGVWTGDGTIEGAASLTYDGANFQLTGDIGATATRITKGWFTDLQVTNNIAGSITGNAATVTTITGLAPDTATTQATQASITTTANLTTVGALNAGSVTSGFGAIDNGASAITTTGTISGGDGTFTGDLTGDVGSIVTTAATLVLVAADCRGQIYYNGDADVIDYTLPTAVTGLSCCFGADTNASVITIDLDNTSDSFHLDGVDLVDGNAIDSPGAVGDFICVHAQSASIWNTWGRSGTWVDGGTD